MPIRGSQQLTEALRMLGLRLPPADTPQAQLPTDPADFEQRLANPSVMEPSWLTMLRTGKDLVKGTITGGGEQPGRTAENLGAILGMLGPVAMARILGPSRGMPSEAGFLHHATSIENADDISRSALKPHRPWFGTDQQEWPDMMTEPRSYFARDAGVTEAFAPAEGKPAVLRVKESVAKFRRESGTGDMFTKDKIKPADLEIWTDEGWVPLLKIAGLER